jgi:hypothetical protein
MRRRGFLRVLVVAVGVVVLAVGAARWYLSSRRAADRVQTQLSEALGTPVRVEGVRLGLTPRSTLTGLRVLETDGPADAEPFLTAASVEADASAWHLITGGRPRNVTLQGAALTLRFDESGNLLSRLPHAEHPLAELPHLRVRGGTVTLRQTGRPDLVVRGARAELVPGENRVTLEGEFDDPKWGKGTVRGSFDPEAGKLDGKLTTGVVRLTHDDLAALPFVPAETWRQVRCAGETSAEIGVRLNTRDPAEPAHYRVVLQPRRTKVLVTAIDLTAEDALGRVTVEDGVVRLDGVEGAAAGGTISTSAVLDFRHPASDLKFDIGARKLELQRLPEGWKLPRLVDGRVSGKAELRVTVEGGRPRTAGRGEGEITGVSVLGFEAREPLRLRIVADGDGFHFDIPKAVHVGGP